MPKHVWSDFPFCTLIQSQQLHIHNLVVQTRNFQYMGIINQARHPHKHISKPLLMVNHNLQLHVECFEFEGVIISYIWTNGLLNVYMSDINSTTNIWQTTIFFETSHNFYQLFLFKPMYFYFYTQHWLQIQIPTTPHGLLIYRFQTIHYDVGIQLHKQIYKRNKQHGFLW